MTNEQKKQVREALVRYTAKFATQALAAESLEGVSSATISQVKNNNWELLSNRLWFSIARQVGFYNGEWQPADTSAYLLLRILFGDAQHYAMIYGISMGTGMGKTFAASRYVREHEGTYYVACNEMCNRKSFMAALMNAAGMEAKGSVPEMMEAYTAKLIGNGEPVIIFDDADKLKDRVLHLIVLLANSFAGKAGIIIMGGDRLRSRIIEGVRMKKVGYDEIFASIGRRFITLSSLGPKDIELVCQANGLHYDDVINDIKEECTDLHQATQAILKHTAMSIAA